MSDHGIVYTRNSTKGEQRGNRKTGTRFVMTRDLRTGFDRDSISKKAIAGGGTTSITEEAEEEHSQSIVEQYVENERVTRGRIYIKWIVGE